MGNKDYYLAVPTVEAEVEATIKAEAPTACVSSAHVQLLTSDSMVLLRMVTTSLNSHH